MIDSFVRVCVAGVESTPMRRLVTTGAAARWISAHCRCVGNLRVRPGQMPFGGNGIASCGQEPHRRCGLAQLLGRSCRQVRALCRRLRRCSRDRANAAARSSAPGAAEPRRDRASLTGNQKHDAGRGAALRTAKMRMLRLCFFMGANMPLHDDAPTH